MHVPFPDIAAFDQTCWDLVKHDAANREYKRSRRKYCALLLLTDSVIGQIVGTLKETALWTNTLLIFSTDNGGETARGASNYPFRGTKGELFEGNTRVLTAVSGGVVESAGLSGQRRAEMVSNLDWTPTLLEAAGYLRCIDHDDRSWDGQSQWALIMDPDRADPALKRQHLVLNIGDESLRSASMVMEHGGSLYKYIRSDPGAAADRWVYSESMADVWSTFDDDGTSLKIIEYDASDSMTRYSQRFDDAFLFDLSSDPMELYNLLDPDTPNFDEGLNTEIVSRCTAQLRAFVDEQELFSRPLSLLHSRLDEGDPSLKFDGLFVRPFLSNKRYAILLKRMFLREQKKGYHHSQKQQDLYLNPWRCPLPMDGVDVEEVQSLKSIENEHSETERERKRETHSDSEGDHETVDIDGNDIEQTQQRPKWPVLGEVDSDSDRGAGGGIIDVDDGITDQDMDSRPRWPVLGEVDSDSGHLESAEHRESADMVDDEQSDDRPRWPVLGVVDSDSDHRSHSTDSLDSVASDHEGSISAETVSAEDTESAFKVKHKWPTLGWIRRGLWTSRCF